MKPLSVFLLNCDWKDMFRDSFVVLKDKLYRDRLGGDINSFYIFSWARTSYFQKKDSRFSSLHRKTKLDYFRPLLDVWTFPVVIYHVWKNKIKNDVWTCYDFGFAPTLWVLKKLFGGKFIMCLNNQPRMYSKTRRFGSIKSIYSWIIEKLFYRLPDHFFTINETMRSYLITLGVDTSKITVFSMNTIDRDKDFIAQAQKGVIRKKYSIPENNKILLTVARLEAEKNYHRLLELFSGLGDGYTLIALGSGSLFEELKAKCKDLGIENRVIFAGFVHRDEIWNFYADADVFVLLSKVEALGVVFWEAMYAQVPIVGSIADGIVETIGKDGDRGRIWEEAKGQEGFNEIIKTARLDPAMLVRAKTYVEEKISNHVTINNIV